MSFGGAPLGGGAFGSGGQSSALGEIIYYVRHQWTVFITQIKRRTVYIVEQQDQTSYVVQLVRKVLHI